MTRRLVARLDNLGDVLLAGPAVRAVAATGGPVDFLAGPHGAAAARLLPGVDQVMVFDAPWVSFDPPGVDPAATAELIASVFERAISEALILTSFHQSPLPLALLLRFAGVDRIGATCVDYPGSLLDVRLPYVEELHEVEQSLALCRAMGHHPPAEDDGRLAISAPDDEPVGTTLFAEPYVVVHPGASVPARSLPVDPTADVVRSLVMAERHVVITGSSGESALAHSLVPTSLDGSSLNDGSLNDSSLDDGSLDDGSLDDGSLDDGSLDDGSLDDMVSVVAGATSFAGTAEIIRRAEAVVCGNTGIAHLAAAVGTPVIELFAPVVPVQRWRPWKVPHVLLGDLDIACAGCRARTCPHAGQPCLAPYTSEAVLDALEELRGARRPTPVLCEAGPR